MKLIFNLFEFDLISVWRLNRNGYGTSILLLPAVAKYLFLFRFCFVVFVVHFITAWSCSVSFVFFIFVGISLIAATKVSCRSRRSGGAATQDGVIVLPTKTGAEEYLHAFKYITLNNWGGSKILLRRTRRPPKETR